MSLGSRFIRLVAPRFFSHCDSEVAPSIDPEQAQTKRTIKTPVQFDNLKQILGQASVDSYDGFRFIVQKQLNLNCVVSHFFWTGSQQTGRPIYQYRLIAPLDEHLVVNVASDADMGLTGDVKAQLTTEIGAKLNFTLNDQSNSVSLDVDHQDKSSVMQVSCAMGQERTLGFSMMQAINPYLTLGGSGKYNIANGKLSTAVAGIVENNTHTFAAQYDTGLHAMYMKKVYPGRVHLSTELVVDEKSNSQMTASAEFILKQSKIHVSLDSNLFWRTAVDSQVMPGSTLQATAEIGQLNDHYRFGFGFIAG